MPRSTYKHVTDELLAQLDQTNPDTWVCPWHQAGAGLPTNGKTTQRYRGINILSLWAAARRQAFHDNRWASYRQWQSLGAQVRRGEKGSLVFFYKETTNPADRLGESEDSATQRRYVMRTSVVFNADQVDGISKNHERTAEENWTTDDFDDFVTKTGAVVRFGGDQALYSPIYDEIHLPQRDHFKTSDGFIATLGHELVHWTGAKSRLSRDLSGRFGKQAYAAEELVAEIGAAFLLARHGLASTPHPNHAAYVASWLPLLREDPRAIFVAAAQASRAVEWLFEITSQSSVGEPPAQSNEGVDAGAASMGVGGTLPEHATTNPGSRSPSTEAARAAGHNQARNAMH